MTSFGQFKQYLSQFQPLRELLGDSSDLFTASLLVILAGVTFSSYYRRPRESRLLLAALGLAVFSDFILNHLHQMAYETFYAALDKHLTTSAKNLLLESARSSVELICLGCRGFIAWLIMTAVVPRNPTPYEEAV